MRGRCTTLPSRAMRLFELNRMQHTFRSRPRNAKAAQPAVDPQTRTHARGHGVEEMKVGESLERSKVRHRRVREDYSLEARESLKRGEVR